MLGFEWPKHIKFQGSWGEICPEEERDLLSWRECWGMAPQARWLRTTA